MFPARVGMNQSHPNPVAFLFEREHWVRSSEVADYVAVLDREFKYAESAYYQ